MCWLLNRLILHQVVLVNSLLKINWTNQVRKHHWLWSMKMIGIRCFKANGWLNCKFFEIISNKKNLNYCFNLWWLATLLGVQLVELCNPNGNHFQFGAQILGLFLNYIFQIWKQLIRQFIYQFRIKIGAVDVTANPGLTGRFMVTALPSIYQ